MIQMRTPLSKDTFHDSFCLANAVSLVIISTGSTVVLNFIIVRPLASVIVGSQPSGNRSSIKKVRRVSISPPKMVNSVEPLGSTVSPV